MKVLSNIIDYTVTQLNKSIKNIIEGSFLTLRVVGEVSQVKKHSSGHIYFTLKDQESSLSAICWRSNVNKLNVKIEEGSSVVIIGRITTYSPQSKYQLIVEQVEYQGEGLLLKVLEDRKKMLSKEGLFDDDKKKKITPFPSSIGVVTSESGAVFSDIIHRIRERFPLEIILYPVKVQGDSSASEICSALDYFDNYKKNNFNKPDVIIIARGGGSLEDLMPFNEEKLVRKIFSCSIPIVSAVGHETDITLCDFVSDLRAPTPSAAAEIIVPERKEILIRFDQKILYLKKIMASILEKKKNKITILKNRLPDLKNKVNTYFQSLDFFEQKLINEIKNTLSEKKLFFIESSAKLNLDIFFNNFEVLKEKITYLNENLTKQVINLLKTKKHYLNSSIKYLDILSYKETLRRGFAVVKNKKMIVKNSSQVRVGDDLSVEFYKNEMRVKKIK
tara:strand:- start:43 stop:1380 length:1338 start_codon:yes stop_codon:yes gene_type:complete